MNIEHLTVLLPCYTLEDLDLRRGADEAEQLLAAWTALWHPVLIHRAGCTPGWLSAEQPPPEPANHLLALPPCCEALLPDGWAQRAEAAGSRVVRTERSRAVTVELLLASLEPAAETPAAGAKAADVCLPPAEPGGAASPQPTARAALPADPELVADFFALGFCHLCVELLTRQLRYMSNLDQSSFQQKLLAAARDGLAGGHQAAREHIQAAFDLLYEAREYFYPVESYLIDLTLVANTTLGEPLRRELRSGRPCNLLLCAEMLEQLAAAEPETLAELRTALKRGTAAIAGAELREGPLPLLPPAAIAWRIARGLSAFDKHLGLRPAVFARRRFGLTPMMPAILRGLGFLGALHQALDEGRFPAGNQSRIRWEGLDGTTIDAIGRVALDVSRAETFLRLPEVLGNAMDLDQTATVVLAHWAGRASPWYDDLKRAAGYTRALGSFVTLPRYFEQTGYSGQRVRYEADQYRSPYLRQAVAEGLPDPISRWVRYYRRRAVIAQLEALQLLAACCGGRRPSEAPTTPNASEDRDTSSASEAHGASTAGEDHSGRDSDEDRGARAANQPPCRVETSARAAEHWAGWSTFDFLVQAVEDSLDQPRPTSAEQQTLDQRLDDELARAAARFAHALSGLPRGSASRRQGAVVVNPTPFQRRACVELAGFGEELIPGGAVRLVEQRAEKVWALVDLPPMGFAWLGPQGDEPQSAAGAQRAAAGRRGWLRRLANKRSAEEQPPLAEENLLRNEFIEVSLDPVTGAIQAISDYKTRGPRLAQQLALRSPVAGAADAGEECHYSIMAAERIEVVSAGPLVGELLCCGRLVDREGVKVAAFRQTTRLSRGSRVVELLIELDIERAPGPNPWDCYYASRFAWSDATASLYRAVNLADRPTEAALIEAPLMLDIRSAKTRTTILSAGLPYHRRFGLRKLDTLLIVAGESARRFRLGIGIDLPGPVAGAWQFLAPPPVVEEVAAPGTAAGWLFLVEARNVMASGWQPFWDSAGLAGLRVQLWETEGRQTRLGLRACRPPRWARRIDPPDAPARPLAVEGDRVTIELAAHAWANVEIGFTGEPPSAEDRQAET